MEKSFDTMYNIANIPIIYVFNKNTLAIMIKPNCYDTWWAQVMCKNRLNGLVECGSNPDLYLNEEAETYIALYFLQTWAMKR